MQSPSRGSHFLPLWKSKNSSTSGQFSRKCFSSPFCRQLEMLRDRLTAEAGGLGRRLFDQGWVSSEISFTLSLSLSLSLFLFPPYSSLFPLTLFTSLSLLFYQLCSSLFHFSSSHVPCKRPALWPCLLAPQGSQTGGGSVTQLRQMGALRMASQESKRWWEGSRG